MRSLSRHLLSVLFLAAVVAAPAAAQTGAGEPREIVRAFHAALQAGDSARALALLHPEATVYEGGHAETRAEYRSGHLAADVAFAQAVRRETVRDDWVEADGAALYTAETAARGTFRGRQIDSRGTETVVLVRTPDGWRIRHVHWSSR